MKVPLDANLPHGLRLALPDHSVFTATHQGGATLKNGQLLATAEADRVEVLLAADGNLAYQQNMSVRARACRAQHPKLVPHPDANRGNHRGSRAVHPRLDYSRRNLVRSFRGFFC